LFPQSPADGTASCRGKGTEIAVAEPNKTIAELNGDRSCVYLTGFSAGGNGAWYLALRRAERFAALVVVAGHVAETSWHC
jgi:predicted peptidase